VRPHDLHLGRIDTCQVNGGSRPAQMIENLARRAGTPSEQELTESVCAGAVDAERVLKARERRRRADPAVLKRSLEAVEHVTGFRDN
jgi:hypothetical protein